MNVAWKFKSSREGVGEVGKSKVALTNKEFKGKSHTCGKYGHKENKCPKINNSEEKGNKKFMGTSNHCGEMGHEATKGT